MRCSLIIRNASVNEPWQAIPMNVMQEFYWRSYRIVQAKAPHWITFLHDSFRLNPENFANGFFKNCDNFAVDSHIYQAWAWENPPEWFQLHACLDRDNLVLMESLGVPILVGEWSLATDNCAMWLNGLNDNGKFFSQPSLLYTLYSSVLTFLAMEAVLLLLCLQIPLLLLATL